MLNSFEEVLNKKSHSVAYAFARFDGRLQRVVETGD